MLPLSVYEAVLNSSPTGHYLLSPSPDPIILAANDTFLRTISRTREALVGKRLFAAFPGDPNDPKDTGVEALRNSLTRVIETGKPDALPLQRYPIIATTPDGKVHYEERFWSAVNAPIFDDNGQLQYIAHHTTDVTEKARAEAALRESESRFRVLAEASPALTWQVDAEGNAIFLNQRYLDVTGLSPAQLLAQGWHSILHPDDLASYLQSTNTALQQQAALQSRVRLKTKEGAWRWFETYAAPWHSTEGKHQGHVGVTIDITEILKTQEALKEADRRKDEFLATLAHELRNPLAPIVMALQLLKHTNTGGRRAADRMIGIMDRQVTYMVHLVDDLLEISRITEGKIKLSKSRINLLDVIHGAIESSMPHIEEAKHQLTLALPEQPVWVNGDAVRLNQVFSNLLNNAAKYTNDGGQITVTAFSQDQQAVVSVRDNGTGIAPAMLTQVFGLFQQTPESRSKAKGGLGIGLSMVQRLVQMHDGTVEARSEGVNKGSEFIVRLPLMQQADTKPHWGREQEGAGEGLLAGYSVLVVDDNEDAAGTLAAMLEMDGAEVHVVHNGTAALEELERYHPNAVVLDIGLPDISGYEVAQRIRNLPDLQTVRLIALTGWGQESDREKSRISGFNEHLTKPVDIAILEACLTK
jgi:PAS domain S-box-containing protein